MKQFTFSILLAFISLNSFAIEIADSVPVSGIADSIPSFQKIDSVPVSEKPDSCYVFAELRWDPGFFHDSAKIIYTDFMEDIKDKNGKKLKFNGFIRAVNYMSIQGWEVMQIYPYHYGDKEREQIAILRRRVSIEEALSVSQPKTK